MQSNGFFFKCASFYSLFYVFMIVYFPLLILFAQKAVPLCKLLKSFLINHNAQ